MKPRPPFTYIHLWTGPVRVVTRGVLSRGPDSCSTNVNKHLWIRLEQSRFDRRAEVFTPFYAVFELEV